MRRIYPFALLLILVQVPMAQEPAAAPAPSTALKTEAKHLVARRPIASHRIGPGDVLDIRVFNQPKFSREAVRVDDRGMISMPLIPDDIQAACRTENELAREITRRYLEYLRNPQVDVFVKEFQSQPVAVIGAVTQPGRFLLQRQVRLLELLSFAGGPKLDQAGQTVQIVHGEPLLTCQKSSSDKSELPTSFVSYNLIDTLRGDDLSNPYVQPGDIITIPEAEQAFVVGNVFRPSSIPLKEPITLSRAVAMAGGTMPDTKSDGVRLIRQVPGSLTTTQQIVNLKAINRQQAPDIMLQAGDIVEVPTSAGKTFLRSLVGTIAPSLSQMPVRVIP